MEKSKIYKQIRFSSDVLREAYQKLHELTEKRNENLENDILSVVHDDATWKHDSVEEFFSDYRKFRGEADFVIRSKSSHLRVSVLVMGAETQTLISVRAPARAEVESIYDIFERHLESSKLPEVAATLNPPIIFIGHGRSQQWRDLQDHLHYKHEFKVEAYETGARAGHTIRDILEEMVLKSSFALLVLTAEDEQSDGSFHARQNVIHETGLFQGRLGFHRAIVLMEDGVQEFSNIQGIQQIRYSRGNIRETFGDVLATLRREFSS